MHVPPIELRGVRVHNLKNLDVDIPRNQLVVVCGVSGSGKTSLALDTLYAEGQRRYVESFSLYTRQFLEQMDKPDAERISGIPASIAVARRHPHATGRATVATATELIDYLRLMFARVGCLICPECGASVRKDSADSIAARLALLPSGCRFQIAFPLPPPADGWNQDQWIAAALRLHEEGFLRMLCHGRMYALPDLPGEPDPGAFVVVDRLKSSEYSATRLHDSVETALRHGQGRCAVFAGQPTGVPKRDSQASDAGNEATYAIDGQPWDHWAFSQSLQCDRCQIQFPPPEPNLFSFNSPWGACPSCEGFGTRLEWDMDLIVPDTGKSLRAGAIAPWNSPTFRRELDKLLALADECQIPVDLPYAQLSEEHRQLIRAGIPERQFGGLEGFFAGLEAKKYKVHIRAMMGRWRSERTCSECQGTRLRPIALAWRLNHRNIAEVCSLPVSAATRFFEDLPLSKRDQQVSRGILDQIRARLAFLEDVGLSYLTLDRSLRSLSGGELHRVTLTTALGSSLVNMLYVLDEPSAGLHPSDAERMLQALMRLRNRRNSVVVVEHEESILRAADHILEIGPGAGEQGGRLVFGGSPSDLLAADGSTTGDYLAGRRGRSVPASRRAAQRGSIRLTNARGNNLRGLDVEFPLGVLCVVSGVSGAGKSTLVQDTLYPALCRRKRKEVSTAQPYDDVFGDGQIDDVVCIDQSPVGRTARSNPVTYVKAFDAIRTVFAETIEARTRNISASAFSFNVEGGRCENCHGDGCIQVDMQFLSDVVMRCPDCQGRRYRREILNVTYRGVTIADVLDLSTREAISLFRGHEKVQERLRPLIHVGLDYLRLGQPANTLSAGESQRLKLASYLSRTKRNRTLFLLDEPTTGLHFKDVVQLLDCFDMLLAAGHSLIVVEHNLQLMLASDYIIDLGPGAADAGGHVVCRGTPEQVAQCHESLTGSYLRRELERIAQI